MSLTLTLTGHSSILESTYFPTINLEGGDWEIGLLNLETFNSIPNIKDGVITTNNQFHHLPEGSYEVEDIEKWIKETVGEDVSIKANRNTLKTEIISKHRFRLNKELCDLLGFEATTTIEPDTKYVSLFPANISKVNVVRINCNVAQGSYLNGKPTHTLHEFFPSVPPGYRIIEVPFTVIYHAINTTQIKTLTLELLDQCDQHVNFRGEAITVRLHLRRVK